MTLLNDLLFSLYWAVFLFSLYFLTSVIQLKLATVFPSIKGKLRTQWWGGQDHRVLLCLLLTFSEVL